MIEESDSRTKQDETVNASSAAVKSKESPLRTILWMLGFIFVYYALQAWILPAAGVQT